MSYYRTARDLIAKLVKNHEKNAMKDAVFWVHRSDEQYCIANPLNRESHRVELGITRPAVKIAALNSAEDLEHNDWRIIFP